MFDFFALALFDQPPKFGALAMPGLSIISFKVEFLLSHVTMTSLIDQLDI